MTGAFAAVALELLQHRLAVIPLGGDDGKAPLVKWQRWRHPPGRDAIATLTAKHPGANIGVLTGLSGLTVVDVDDPALVDRMLRRCGTTPMITETPSGGVHLWYRAASERSGDCLRRREGLDVDIKGLGGLVVVPPSVAWSGAGKGRAYRLVKGSWDDLAALPRVNPGSLPTVEWKVAAVTHLRAVGHGFRNNTLLKLLLRRVRFCDTEADLLDVAETMVAEHFELHSVPPFPPAEIAKTARSAWNMEQQGRNWVGQGGRIVLMPSEFAILEENLDALGLFVRLVLYHGDSPKPFPISPKAMARDESMAGWRDPRRYARARDFMLEQGCILCTHAGGSAPGDASLYCFPPRRLAALHAVPEKGARDAPYTNTTPRAPDRTPGRAPNLHSENTSPDVGSEGAGESGSESGDRPHNRHQGKNGAPVGRRGTRLASCRGRPPLRVRVLQAMAQDPPEVWRRALVMERFGVGAGEAQRALGELVAAGEVERVAYGQYRAAARAA